MPYSLAGCHASQGFEIDARDLLSGDGFLGALYFGGGEVTSAPT
ncbi:hypothetical protein OZK63_11060 [Streptomyces sp. UMAF16]|nr:hypothetical protein [Streptomyces sp. UMAF16]